ncbi:hypothetical protein B932_1136 [Gluconobacter oxydans H24]|nr:hypothetical protein B932_1136 [Gluconobacter oxydans H24]
MVEPIFVGDVEDAHPFSINQVKAMGGRIIETSHSLPIPKQITEFLAFVWNADLGDVSKNDAS